MRRIRNAAAKIAATAIRARSCGASRCQSLIKWRRAYPRSSIRKVISSIQGGRRAAARQSRAISLRNGESRDPMDAVDTQPKSKAISSPRVILAGGAALLLGLFVYFYIVCYRDYLLNYDAIAFVGALSSPQEWFTQGYLHYFEIYPGWSSDDQWDLVRPFANFIGYANQVLFGEHYALHFALFYLAQLCGLALFLRLLRETS